MKETLRPGYKQTEVGVIPEDWNAVNLGSFISLQRGHDLTWRERRRGEIPVMGSAGQNGCHDTAIAKGPGVVLGRSGASFGQAHYCEQDFWPHNTALYVTDFHANDPLFAFYFLTAIDFSRHNSGGAQQSLNRNFIAPIPIGLPRPHEQRAIAAALSDVDALLAKLDQLIAKKRDLKQAAMQQLLTGQIRLPGFSGAWEVKRLGEICEIAMGRTPPRLNSAMWGKGHVWLSIADLDGKVVLESKEQITDLAAASMSVIPKGTLLMSFKLSIGRLCFAGCNLYTNEAICSFGNLQAEAEFLYYALGRTDFQLYGKQAVKGYTLNKGSLNLVEVRLPPRDEQTAIAAILSDMDADIADLEARRDKTRALKQGMMQELLTGRIRLV
jgi:type I restriction enzyme S subunit